MIFDFLCECGNKFEKLIDPHEHEAMCSKCGKEAPRIISPVRLDWRMGVDSSMPTMYDKWEKMHKQAAKADKKNSE